MGNQNSSNSDSAAKESKAPKTSLTKLSPEEKKKFEKAKTCVKQLLLPKAAKTPEEIQDDEKVETVRPELWDFPFENLVLEGGGNKGIAYSGLIKCLEDVGILQNLKRFGGASAGAMAAAFVALGYSAEEIQELLNENLQPLFNDGHFPAMNLFNKFGMHPADKFYEWMSDKIAKKSPTGNAAMTFYDLYRERNVELCIAVTNLNLMRMQYCHVKTSPDMPIRDAVRMSMSIPIYFQPKIYATPGTSNTDYYVDGGVLNNYPISCFDGWGLSMDPKDSYLKRMNPFEEIVYKLETQYDGVNTKTMGAVLYDENERDLMRFKLESRIGADKPDIPETETKLFVERHESTRKFALSILEKKEKMEAVNKFMNALGDAEDEDIVYIDLAQLTKALSEISEAQAKILFGDNHSPDAIMKRFDLSRDGKISLKELVEEFDVEGVKLWEFVYGYSKLDKIDNLMQFVGTIYNTCSLNLMASHMKAGDEKRTVGINTGYVSTMDFDLEPEDKTFAFLRGYNATKSFLKYFIVQNEKLVKMKGTSSTTASSSGAQGSSTVSPKADADNVEGAVGGLDN